MGYMHTIEEYRGGHFESAVDADATKDAIIEQLKGRMKSASETMEGLQNEMQALREENTAIGEGMSRSAKKAAREADDALELLTKQKVAVINAKLKREFEARTAQIETSKTEAIETALKMWRTDTETAAQKLADVQQRHAEVLANLKQEHAQALQPLSEITEVKNDLAQEYTKLYKVNKEQSQQLTELQETNNALTETNAKLTQQHEEGEKELDEMSEEIKTLEQQLGKMNAVKAELSKLKSEKPVAFPQGIKKYEAQNKALRGELEKRQIKIKALEKKIASMRTGN